jgi:3-hydroxyacyl-[acyl-carrier-protein] dehydratase
MVSSLRGFALFEIPVTGYLTKGENNPSCVNRKTGDENMRFIFVDKICELDPGKRIVALKRLTAEEELFRDHFPGFPVVPGVLLTEMMAQAAGKCIDAEGSHSGRAMLARIQSASFHEWVRPDDDSMIHAEVIQNRPTYATAKCFVEVNGKQMCSAELFFVFVPYARFAKGFRDEILEAYWKDHPRASAPEPER